MSKRRTAVAITLAGVVSAGALAAAQLPVQADPAPTATDVVGVGSDIIQNSVDFLADGDFLGHPGYNSAGNKNRLINFSATADGNGRNGFTDPALGTPAALNPTIVLRAGTSPVQRPNGGGAGLNALLADGDATNGHKISFVRSPNLPTSAQATNTTPGVGPLHTVQFADDTQYIAAGSATNAPATLSVADLVSIYSGSVTKWNQLPGNSGGSAETIIPLIPQTGAGVRTIFLNALKAANGGTTPTLVGVTPVQQNDPTTITSLSSADQKNAIVPFPQGRYTLLSKGYFRNPNTAYNSGTPATTLTADGIKLIKSAGSFSADIPYYAVFRESDLASTTPWQPGSTLNWAQTLFANGYDPDDPDPDVTPPFVASAAGKAVIEAIGLTPVYHDLGAASNG
jgi:ABC-type phosphate transport system substrate-binding protein